MQQKKHKKTKMYNYCKIGKNKEKYRDVTDMNVNRKMLVFVAVVAAVATGTMLYFSKEEEEPQKQQVYVREEKVEKQEEAEYYRVSIVGEDVVLCRISDGESTEIERMEIDTDYYPEGDIQELTKGITAYNIEEGYGILENFAN